MACFIYANNTVGGARLRWLNGARANLKASSGNSGDLRKKTACEGNTAAAPRTSPSLYKTTAQPAPDGVLSSFSSPCEEPQL